jgi:protein-disulfide isomerase
MCPLEVLMLALSSPAPCPRRRSVAFPVVALALAALAFPARSALAQDEPRLRVPVDATSPQRGPADALVTLVEFSDFQCPFCGRVQATLTELQQRYGRDLRIVWRNLPLAFHQDAQPAAEAALAAHAAGRFWSMHDLLFQNQQALDRAALEQYATQLGLDLATFRDALDRRRYRAAVDADARLAADLGISGTPSFVINGRKLVGAQPVDAFAKVIDEELAAARRLLAERRITRDEVYREVQRGAVQKAAAPAPAAGPAAAAPRVDAGQPDPAVVYKVPVARSPVKGRATAKLTVVMFGEFQCPFCARVVQTLEELEQKYGADISFVFKHNPLPFHPHAALAAEAALAAHAQGKFWRMHDKLFRNQQHLDRPALEVYAEEIGLDLKRFMVALDRHSYKKDVAEDMKLAAQLGARGTPTFFINGRVLTGAQARDAFVALCDEELKRAEAALRKGTRPHRLYEALTAKGEAGPKRAAPVVAADAERVKVVVEPRDPAAGPKTAKVTLVVFSDFQCPFCSRLAPTLRDLRKRYPRDLRVVFKQLPLPFHQHARLAAEASLAAHAQGKFWEMHDKLFTEQQALDRDSLLQHAQNLRLSVDRFRRALDDGTYRAQVEADSKHAAALGIQGTPTMVINGRKLSGARSADDIAPTIDDELRAARQRPGKK